MTENTTLDACHHEPAPIERDPDISVYVSSLSGLDTAIEYAQAFANEGLKAVLCLDSGIDADADATVRDYGMRWLRLQDLSRWESRVVRFHRNLINIGTSFVAGANPAYRTTGPLGGPRNRVKRALMRLLRALPGRPAASTWNRWGPTMFGRLLRPRFPSEWVVVVSVAANPLFLCHRRLTVDTVVDSWDHPSRKVSGYPTRTVIAWNGPLAEDWLRFQGAQHWMSAPPRKLTYALASNPVSTPDRGDQPPRLLYPVATSPNVPDVFADELLLLEAMAEACDIADWELLVKPRPDAVPPVLVETIEALNGAVLGHQLKQTGRALDYRLTAEYNKARIREMAAVEVVVSTVTTFGLDAACARRPILQVDLRQMADLPALAAISQNHHLRTHLYGLPSVVTPSDRTELIRTMADLLWRAGTNSDWSENSAALRAWVVGDGRDATDVARDLRKLRPALSESKRSALRGR